MTSSFRFPKKIAYLVLSFTVFGLFGCDKDTEFGKVHEPYVRPSLPTKSLSKTLPIDEQTIGKGQLDILWVIDNSGSMGTYQQGVISGTSAFINQFTLQKDLEWKMGLISTDISNLPFLGFLSLFDHLSPNPVPTFQNAVRNLGVSGSSDERTFDPVASSFQRYTGFLRSEAYLALIMVTDEMEGSSITHDVFWNHLVQLKGSAEKVFTYGVFLLRQRVWGSSGDPNGQYAKFINLSKGVQYDMESPDYGVLLAKIGEDLVNKVTVISPLINLDERPILETLRVSFKGRVLPPGQKAQGGFWIFEPTNNVLRFTNTDLFSSAERTVDITYQPMAEYQ